MFKQVIIIITLSFIFSTQIKASTSTQDIVDTAIAAGSFNSLASALTSAGLVETLKGPGPFTVFAPTDDAFAALPTEIVNALLADPETLANVLTYHVLSGKVLAADVIAGGNTSVMMVNGNNAQITVSDNGVMIDDANVIQTDILASNGVIHVIDKVIVPETLALISSSSNTIVDIAVGTPELSTLVTALTAAGLVDTLKGDGPFTVFAPTDNAFAALPDGTLESLLANTTELSKVLTHHVVAGNLKASDLINNMVGRAETLNASSVYYAATSSKVKVAEALVSSADIVASNGIIHIIDTVLIPPEDCKSSYDPVSKILDIPCVTVVGDGHTYQVQLEETTTPSNFDLKSAILSP